MMAVGSIKGWLLAAMTGVFIGAGAFTFHAARGGSYLSNDPQACVNCHIMREQYDGWLKSSHHAVATCNDCHVPHDLLGKYLAKLDHGYRHSKAFTFEDFHEPIRVHAAGLVELQDNCLRCHGELAGMIAGHPRSAQDVMSCVRCHPDVGHCPPR
jgi:cytochrome c nitrite reductase small subunit